MPHYFVEIMSNFADRPRQCGRELQLIDNVIGIDDSCVQSIVSPITTPEVDYLLDAVPTGSQVCQGGKSISLVPIFRQLNREANPVLDVAQEFVRRDPLRLELRGESPRERRLRLVGVLEAHELGRPAALDVVDGSDHVFKRLLKASCVLHGSVDRGLDSRSVFVIESFQLMSLGGPWIEVLGDHFGHSDSRRTCAKEICRQLGIATGCHRGLVGGIGLVVRGGARRCQ
jgi:hypothetical protein